MCRSIKYLINVKSRIQNNAEKISLCFLIIVWSIVSCSNPIEPFSLKNYFPLEIGNQWAYKFPWWTPSSGDTILTYNYKIIKKNNVNGIEYYTFNYRMPFFPNNLIIKGADPPFVRQNKSADIMFLVANSEYPYFVFSKIIVDSLIRTKVNEADYYYQIEAIDETVDTEIGQFKHCIKILNYFPQIKGTEYYTWFAPGYGPVKIYYPEFGITYELTKLIIQ